MNVDTLLGECASSAQVDCTSPVIASFIVLALDRVIDPSGTIKGSLLIGHAYDSSFSLSSKGFDLESSHTSNGMVYLL